MRALWSNTYLEKSSFRRKVKAERFPMPTIQVTISAETEAVLKQKIESGEYQSASAVLEAGLGLHEDRVNLAKLEALRHAIQGAEESENATPGVFERLR
jgi:putative addiction module CopG family antidote